MSTITPVENDTRLAALAADLAKAERSVRSRLDSIHSRVDRRVVKGRIAEWKMTDQEAMDAITEPFLAYMVTGVEEARAAVAAARKAMVPFQDEYRSRGWSRFFIVAGGHIHASMDCSTCNNGATPTQFGWLPDLSGKTEADAVAAHGALLCTVCFPSAPTEWTNHYEAAEAAKKAANCSGSLTMNYDRTTARLGYFSGNWAICNECHEQVTVTASNKMRSHKAKAATA